MNEIATLCERNLLGAVLQSDEAQKQLDRLSPEDMGDPVRQKLLMAALRLRQERKPIDLQSVCALCGDAMALTECIACIRATPSTVMAAHYADELLKQSMRRKLYRIAEGLAQESLGIGDPSEIATMTMDKLRALGSHKDGCVPLGQMAADAYDDVARLASGEITYLKTGIPDMDRYLGGLYQGEMTILAARPGVGKSAMAEFIAYDAAKRGKKVCVASLEMSPLQYAKRLLSAEADIDGRKLRTGKGITPEEWERMAAACGEMQTVDMPFIFSIGTVEELRAQCQHRMDTQGMDLLVIDYIQLLRTRQSCEGEYARITAVSHAVKRMALELNIPILALAQVSRPEMKGRARMPTLDTLRGSGDLEQDADGVMMLHEPSDAEDSSIPDYDRDTARALMARGEKYIVVSVAKQRNGVCGAFGLAFDAKHMTYQCIAH